MDQPEAFNAALLGPNDPRLTTLVDGSEYAIALDRDTARALGGTEGLERRIADLLDRDSWRALAKHKPL